MEQKRKSPSLSDLKEGWERLARSFLILKNKKTGKKIVIAFNEGLKYLIEKDREWEVQQLLEGEAAKTLYGEIDKNKKNGD